MRVGRPRARLDCFALAVARADGTQLLLRKIARTDVLIVDDWAMNPLAEMDFYEIWLVMTR